MPPYYHYYLYISVFAQYKNNTGGGFDPKIFMLCLNR